MRTPVKLTTAILAAATALSATMIVTLALATPASAATVSLPLRTLIASLPVATEVRTGYDRTLFNHWIDADGDGCNTRYEVLIAEAVTAPTVGSGCSLSGGRWYSYYDGAYWTLPSDLDIDHMVPLAEAWDSGARNWTAAQREAYANDIGDSRPLAAVTDNVNQSKSDRDPAEWMPPLSSAYCRYISEWAATKTRWALTVDSAEKAALTSYAASCANSTVTVTTMIGSGPTTSPSTTPSATPSGTPSATPSTGACAGTNGTDVDIPDAGVAVTSAITISGCSGSASSTSTVYVNITHTYRGDLVISLIAPDGSTYPLKNSSGSDGAANVDATYTVNLSSETRDGTWRLQVQDVYTEDEGYLNTWTLTL